MRKLSLTQLRSNLYQTVDNVIKSGVPVEVERHGYKVQIRLLQPKKSKLDNLVKNPRAIIGDPEDIVHMDWSSEWNEEKNL